MGTSFRGRIVGLCGAYASNCVRDMGDEFGQGSRRARLCRGVGSYKRVWSSEEVEELLRRTRCSIAESGVEGVEAEVRRCFGCGGRYVDAHACGKEGK